MYDGLLNSLKNCVYIPCGEAQKEKCLADKEDDCRRELIALAANAIEELSKRVELEYQSGFADGQRAANRKKNKWIGSGESGSNEGDIELDADGYCMTYSQKDEEGEDEG